MNHRFVIVAILAVLGGSSQVKGADDTKPELQSDSTAITYSWSDGFLAAWIKLWSDGVFEFNHYGCTGMIAQFSGRYHWAGGNILFQPADSAPADAVSELDARTFAKEMYRVNWGLREYLISEKRMLDFVTRTCG